MKLDYLSEMDGNHIRRSMAYECFGDFPKSFILNMDMLLVGKMFCCPDNLIFCCFCYSSEWVEFLFMLERDRKYSTGALSLDGSISDRVFALFVVSMGLDLRVQENCMMEACSTV